VETLNISEKQVPDVKRLKILKKHFPGKIPEPQTPSTYQSSDFIVNTELRFQRRDEYNGLNPRPLDLIPTMHHICGSQKHTRSAFKFRPATSRKQTTSTIHGHLTPTPTKTHGQNHVQSDHGHFDHAQKPTNHGHPPRPLPHKSWPLPTPTTSQIMTTPHAHESGWGGHISRQDDSNMF